MKEINNRLKKVEENLGALHKGQKMVSQELKMLGEGLIILTKNLTVLIEAIGKLATTTEAGFKALSDTLAGYINKMSDILEFMKKELKKDVDEEK